MTKDNILFSIIALLLGLIIGFMVANSINRSGGVAPAQAAAASGNQALPPGHPEVPADAQASSQPDPKAMEAVMVAVNRAKSEPGNFDAQMKAAEASYQAQRYDQAIEYLTRANQLRPENYETIIALGNANFDANHFEQAEKWYTAALAKKPEDINARTDLGLSFMFREKADLDRAIAEFRTSLAIDPNHLQTLQNMTVALTRKGEADEAQATLAKLESVSPNNPALPTLRSDLEKLRSSAQSKPAAVKAAGRS